MADVAELIVHWREAGADIPERTKTHLKGLGRAAEEAAPSIGDRMGTAFERLERREPTMVLRRARLEMEMLALSSVGANSGIGRLAAGFALLGGPWGIAAVAAFAAVGSAIHDVTEEAKGLDAATKSLTEIGARVEASQLGSRAPFAQEMGKLVMQRGELSQPGFWENIFGSTIIGTNIGIAPLLMLRDKLAGQRGAERTATQGLIDQLEAVHQREEAVAAEKALAAVTGDLTKAQIQAAAQTDHLHVSTNETALHLFDLDTKLKLTALRLAYEANPSLRDHLLQIEAEARATERASLVHKQLTDQLNLLRPTAGSGNVTQAGVGYIPPGPTYGRAPPLDWMQRPVENVDAYGNPIGELSEVGRIGVMGSGGGKIGQDATGEARQRRIKEETDQKLALMIGTVIAGHMVGLAAAISRGDAGGIIGGLTGAGGGIMSALGAMPGASKMLGPTGMLVSAIGSAAGGLISLFSSHKPKVVISAFEEQALVEIRNLRADPLTTSYVIVGPVNARSLQYDLGRLQRRDAVTRLP